MSLPKLAAEYSVRRRPEEAGKGCQGHQNPSWYRRKEYKKVLARQPKRLGEHFRLLMRAGRNKSISYWAPTQTLRTLKNRRQVRESVTQLFWVEVLQSLYAKDFHLRLGLQELVVTLFVVNFCARIMRLHGRPGQQRTLAFLSFSFSSFLEDVLKSLSKPVFFVSRTRLSGRRLPACWNS